MAFLHDFNKYDDSDAFIWDLIASRVKYEKKTKGNVDEDIKKRFLTFLSDESVSVYNTNSNNIDEIVLDNVKTVISLLCRSASGKDEQHIIVFYNWLKNNIEEKYRVGYNIDVILDGLYKKQPALFLNVFVGNSNKGANILRMLKNNDRTGHGILSKNHLEVVISWCNMEPDKRYYKIFDCMYGYERVEGIYRWKRIALVAMEQVKNRKNMAIR